METKHGSSMREERMAESILSVSAAKHNASSVREGPLSQASLNKRQLQPAENTFQVSANIGTMTKSMRNSNIWDMILGSLPCSPKQGWPAPRRESETTQL